MYLIWTTEEVRHTITLDIINFIYIGLSDFFVDVGILPTSSEALDGHLIAVTIFSSTVEYSREIIHLQTEVEDVIAFAPSRRFMCGAQGSMIA